MGRQQQQAPPQQQQIQSQDSGGGVAASQPPLQMDESFDMVPRRGRPKTVQPMPTPGHSPARTVAKIHELNADAPRSVPIPLSASAPLGTRVCVPGTVSVLVSAPPPPPRPLTASMGVDGLSPPITPPLGYALESAKDRLGLLPVTSSCAASEGGMPTTADVGTVPSPSPPVPPADGGGKVKEKKTFVCEVCTK
ncbi:hypothetical protein HK104_007274, partial [Borealophlyctis nickersoniae]